jgi:hypothetical protein
MSTRKDASEGANEQQRLHEVTSNFMQNAGTEVQRSIVETPLKAAKIVGRKKKRSYRRTTIQRKQNAMLCLYLPYGYLHNNGPIVSSGLV